MTADLRLDAVSVTLNDSAILDRVSLAVRPGRLSVMLGPNGAGKTTALKCLAGLVEPTHGTAQLNQADLSSMDPMARARAVALLPQSQSFAWPVRVREVVALGRFAYGASSMRLRGEDLRAVEDAIEACALSSLAGRRVDELSGGEVARVRFARALAARTPFLLADEPIAALDPAHQYRVMDLIRTFVQGGGGACVVMHDLSMAAQYADDLIWMKKGRVVAAGSVEETLTEAQVAEVFGVASRVVTTREAVDIALLGRSESS